VVVVGTVGLAGVVVVGTVGLVGVVVVGTVGLTGVFGVVGVGAGYLFIILSMKLPVLLLIASREVLSNFSALPKAFNALFIYFFLSAATFGSSSTFLPLANVNYLGVVDVNIFATFNKSPDGSLGSNLGLND